MRRPGRAFFQIGMVSAMVAIALAIPAIAQDRGRYSLTGSVDLTTRFEKRSETGNPDTETFQARHGYNLTATGPIYDARLASFTATGAFSQDLIEVDPGPDRTVNFHSLFSSLSLLSGTRFPLGLRFSRSGGEGAGTDTTGTAYGATWNANFKKLPSLQLSYDRSETESEQLSGTRAVTDDSVRVRLSKRFVRSSYELEYERLDTEDSQGFSETGDHGRFSSYHRLGHGLSVNTSALLDLEDRVATIGESDSRNIALTSSVSYLPDPDLSASGGVQFSRTEVGSSFFQSEGANASATKRVRLLPELNGTLFTSGSVNRTASSFLPGEVFWSSGLGGDLTSTQLRTVQARGGYSLAVSKGAAAAVQPGGVSAVGPLEAGALQADHRINLNLASRTLDPYTLTGDYTFILQQGALDRQTHTAALRGTGTPLAGLSFRALLQGSLTDSPVVKVGFLDLSATYSPRFNLSVTSGVSASVVEAAGQTTFISRIPLVLRYQLGRVTAIFLEGFREQTATNVGADRLSHEIKLRVERPFRRIRFAMEIRFRDTESDSNQTQDAQIMFTISRPFGYSF